MTRVRVFLVLAAILTVALVWAVLTQTTRISQIVIGAGGDWVLNVVNPTNGGLATLVPDGVFTFHLQQDGDAGGHQIKNVAAGGNSGDALVIGQAMNNGQVSGVYPNLNVVQPFLRGDVGLPQGPLTAGTCAEVPLTIVEAKPPMVATAAVNGTALEAGAVLMARVVAVNSVAVRVCAISNVTLTNHVANVVVVQ